MATRLTALFEDGHLQVRRTDRPYTHCWRVFIPAGVSAIKDLDGNPITWDDHWIYGWAHSHALATKTASRRCQIGAGRRFEITPALNTAFRKSKAECA